VQSYTRRQMKEDKFAETAKGAMNWASGHQQGTLLTILAVVAVSALVVGLYFWHDRQTEQANIALSKAVRTSEAQLRAPGAPAGEGQSFTSMAERGKQAEKEFNQVADSYPWTRAGKLARYLAATAVLQSGDTATAEKLLKAQADSGGSDIAPLAKMALATIYRSTNRDGEAARIYKDLIDHPTGTVSKAQAQFALAEMYETSDPKQAETIYKQIQDENKDTAIAQLATSKMNPKGK
jgi:hypothetical protein